MSCTLVQLARHNHLSPNNVQEQMVMVEPVFYSGVFDVEVVECRECGQLFIYCFRQRTFAGCEEDSWMFWVPVNQEEVDELREIRVISRFIGDLIARRGTICWQPSGEVSWLSDWCLPVSALFLLA